MISKSFDIKYDFLSKNYLDFEISDIIIPFKKSDLDVPLTEDNKKEIKDLLILIWE